MTVPDLDTPRIFIRLYHLFRAHGHGRRSSLKQAWDYFRHRLD
jgi:hypothetical protein